MPVGNHPEDPTGWSLKQTKRDFEMLCGMIIQHRSVPFKTTRWILSTRIKLNHSL